MDDIQDVHFVDLEKSKYLKPIRMKYTQAGRQKVWDLMKSHSSVAIVIFRTDVKKFVFVRQFRPALYMARAEEAGTPVTIGTRLSQPGKEGMTLELCAGIVDKELSLPEIAKEEVLEECGYEVEASRLQHVVTCPASVGTGGTSQTIFSLEVHFYTAYRVKRDLGKKFLPGDRKGQEGTGWWSCRGGRVHRCCGDGSGGGEKLSGPGEGEQPCWVSLCSPVVSPQQNAFIRELVLQPTCLSAFAHCTHTQT